MLLQVFPFPGKDETYQVPFTKVLYIEQEDFREQDHKKYFGLAPGKSVLLRYKSLCSIVYVSLHSQVCSCKRVKALVCHSHILPLPPLPFTTPLSSEFAFC